MEEQKFIHILKEWDVKIRNEISNRFIFAYIIISVLLLTHHNPLVGLVLLIFPPIALMFREIVILLIVIEKKVYNSILVVILRGILMGMLVIWVYHIIPDLTLFNIQQLPLNATVVTLPLLSNITGMLILYILMILVLGLMQLGIKLLSKNQPQAFYTGTGLISVIT
ncbi:hypothetical protein CEE45_02040 [Candidatus Heimdallarchaeota archaeon B3_Heim]|nr:MAG: hypothetical protein CEE45_02040 [Candidatus Heimdallarchaeota archaeon B3_Heim]